MQSRRFSVNNPRWTVEADAGTRAAAEAAAEQLAAIDPVDDTESFVTAAQLQAAQLPEPFRRELQRFRRFGNELGGLLVKGLPVGAVPPTPTSADDAMGIKLPAARTMSVVVALLGDQYGFKPELGGKVVQDVLPVAGFEYTQQSISSEKPLFDHTEMAFTEHRADYVGLFCIRQDHDRVAGTTLSSVDRMLPLLDPATIATLREKRFKTTVDGSFLRGFGRREPIWIGPIRVLEGPLDRPRLRADFAETRGTDAVAQAALDQLREAGKECATELRLAAGDLLIVDNHRAFHGRTRFTPRWDGRDRWLLRTFVSRDLSRSVAVRPGDGRIVDTDYSTGPDVLG